jgi:MraZ protein
MLIGYFEQKIDNKGRFLFPSVMKKKLSSALSDGFVIKRSIYNTSLELYPMNEWCKFNEEIEKMNQFDRETNDLITLLMHGVKEVGIDEAGRILIPKDLLVASKIEKEIVLASKKKFIEIWSKDVYEEFILSNMPKLSEMAQKILGNRIT